MNPQMLDNLNPIHLPDPVSLWPLAAGWWILISLPFILTGLFMAWSRYRKRPKQLADKTIKELDLKLQQANDARSQQQLLQEINQLLKRISLTLNPRANTAKLSGSAWLEYIQSQNKKQIFTPAQKKLLASGPYESPQSQQLDKQILKELLSCSKQWIKQHP